MFSLLKPVIGLFKHPKIFICDNSLKGEVVYVTIKDGDEQCSKIAFPAHSKYAVLQLIEDLSKELGRDTIFHICTATEKEIEIA